MRLLGALYLMFCDLTCPFSVLSLRLYIPSQWPCFRSTFTQGKPSRVWGSGQAWVCAQPSVSRVDNVRVFAGFKASPWLAAFQELTFWKISHP